MKPSLIIIALFIFINTFSQTQKKSNPNQATRDINNVKGNQTINNSYYTINYNYDKNKSEKNNSITATKGFLKKTIDTTPSIPYIKLGRLTYQGAKNAIQFGSEPVNPINISKLKGQIQIDAVVRDSKGDEIARISGNTWEISNTQNIEYNNDGNGFEIRSGKRVIFQLNIIKDTVFCNGMICTEYGECVYFAPNLPFSSPHKVEGATQRFVLPDNFVLKPLFKYPRFEYLGIRNTDN